MEKRGIVDAQNTPDAKPCCGGGCQTKQASVPENTMDKLAEAAAKQADKKD